LNSPKEATAEIGEKSVEVMVEKAVQFIDAWRAAEK